MTGDDMFSDVIKYLGDPGGHKLLYKIMLAGNEFVAFAALFHYLNEKQFGSKESTDLMIGRLKDTHDWCMRLTLQNQTEEFGREIIAPWLLHWHTQWDRSGLADPWVVYNDGALHVYIPVHATEIP